MKRTLCLFLALILAVGICFSAPVTITASAAAAESDFEYEENDGGITIYWYNGSDSEIVIPDTIGGMPVTTIGSSAFYDCTSLTTIEIPDSVTTIGSYAFYGCTSLTTIEIPDSVTTIGSSAFSGCTSLTTVNAPCSWNENPLYTFEDGVDLDIQDHTYKNGKCTVANCDNACAHETITDGVCVDCGGKHCGKTENDKVVWFCDAPGDAPGDENDETLSILTITGTGAMADYTGSDMPWYNYQNDITNVVIENGVTTIGEYAFFYCKKLTSVTIPDSVTTIGEGAFMDCTELTSVEIPESVETIGEDAFNSCTMLMTITIPQNVTVIGEGVFCNCTRLTEINVAEGNTTYSSEDGVLFNKEKTELIYYPLGKDATSYTIPDGVTSIGGIAFYGCTSLESVTIPDSVTTIGVFAFYGCTSLESVIIPDSVTTIGEGAFMDCTALTSVTIGDRVTTIGGQTFYDCTALTSVTIGKGVTEIDASAFDGCEDVNLIVEPGSYAHEFAKTKNIPYIFNGYTEEETAQIEKLTFTLNADSESYSVTFCNTQISGALKIPATYNGKPVTEIGDFAFADCTSLAAVTIPDSITTIGAGAFYFCIELISITIPESVTTISNSAFYSCTALTSIEVDVNNSTYLSDDNGVLFNKDKTELICYPAGKDATSYTIPDGVKSIGDIAFYDCTSLTTIEIPDSVTTIGSYAFNGCTALASVTIPDSVETIGSQAFSYCTSLTTVSAPCSWNEKPLYTFEDWVKVVIPKHTIENNNCTVCKGSKCGATESDTVTWVYDEGTLYINGTGAMVADYDGSNMPWYSYQDKITKIIIENGVTTIGMSAFSGCDNLTSVTIPKSVTTIGMAAFSGCGLTSVTIPEGVTTIGESAFYGCSELTSVTIGNGETKIYDYAFDGCNNLSTVNVPCNWDTENPPYAFDESVLKKYHNIVNDEAKAPTCTATGLTEGSHCTRCDDKTVVQEVIPALNHKDTLVQVEAKAPTCEAIGWDAYEHCTACDYTTYKEKAKLGHDKVSHSAKSATCEAIGWYAYDTCSRCDYTTYKEIAKLGHDIVSHSAKSATCEAIGWYAYDTCSRCDYTTYKEIAKLGHDIVIDKAVAPTCTKTGLTEGSHCTRCNGATKAQQTIAKKAHAEVTVTGKAATCTATGLTDGKKCSVCGTVTKAQQTIAKKGHTEVIIPKVAPTLTSTGLTEGKKCSVCGTVTVSQQVIAKLVLVAPVITSITSTTGGVKFTWGAVPYAAKYKIYRKTYHPSTGKWDAKWKKINKVEVKGTEYVDSTAKLGTQYMYLVKAVNGKVTKNSAASSIVTFKISPTPTIHLKSNGIKVKWAETVVSAENYRIYRAEYNESTKKYNSYKKVKTVKGTTKSWTDTSVKSGKKYKYCVKAVRGSVVCDKVQTKPIYYLTKPKVTVATATNGIVVNWSAKGASKYRVYRSELQNGVWSGYKEIATPNGKTKTYTDTTAVAGVQYKYKVKAVKSKTGITSSETKAVTR